jgi:Tol biopolymer transport system component
MLVALFYREVRAHRGEPADTTMPETSLYLTRRVDSGWSEPALLPLSGRFNDYEPALHPDGSILVFNSKRPGSEGRLPPHNDLWMVRLSASGWGEPRPVRAVNTFEREESYATLTADGRMIFLKGLGDERYDLYESRLGPDGDFGPAVRSSVSTDEFGEADPMIAPDGSFLIFTRWDTTVGWDKGCDLWIAFREGNGWGRPVALTMLNSPTGPDFAAALSPDGQWLYYRSGRQFLRTPLGAVLDGARRR